MSNVHYQLLSDEIHELTFTSATTQAVDEWVQYQRKLYQETEQSKTLYFLLINSAGTLPINYAFKSMRALIDEFPNRPSTRSAMLHKADALFSLIRPMVNTAVSRTRDSVRFFPLDQRTEAIHWLLQK